MFSCRGGQVFSCPHSARSGPATTTLVFIRMIPISRLFTGHGGVGHTITNYYSIVYIVLHVQCTWHDREDIISIRLSEQMRSFLLHTVQCTCTCTWT